MIFILLIKVVFIVLFPLIFINCLLTAVIEEIKKQIIESHSTKVTFCNKSSENEEFVVIRN